MQHGKKIALRREIGLWQATLSGIGIIFGAGIYALVGEAAGLAGSGVWLAFLISSLLAAFTGLSYAEFAGMFPKAGAEYVFTDAAFGRRLAFLIGWLAVLAGVVGAATVSLGFAGYFSALFQTPAAPVALALIAVLSLVIFGGIRQSMLIAVAFTLVEALGLVLIIFISAPSLGTVDYFSFPSIGGVLSAAALIFFAYLGFEEMTRLSEEAKQPERTIPRALLIAIAVSTVVYILVAAGAVGVLGAEALAASRSPLADVAAKALGPGAGMLLAVMALFSTSNTVLLMLLAASRIMYGMAKEHSLLPAVFAAVHPRRRTPWIAIVVVMFLSFAAILIGDIAFVANLTNFMIYLTFIVINAGIIVLRYRQPGRRRPFRIPGAVGRMPVVPLLGVFSCLLLLFSLSQDILFWGALVAAAGLAALVAVDRW